MDGVLERSRRAVDAVQPRLLVAGTWRDALSGRTMGVENPATGDLVAHVADAGVEDAELAARAAIDTQTTWGRVSRQDRSDILRRAYDIICARVEDLAMIATVEMGKPLREARSEVMYAADFLRWFSESATRVNGEFRDSNDGTHRWLVRHQPIGPALLITPWNFPIAMAARKIAPAIAAGCTIVLKPAPQTPLSSLALAEILVEAGLPAGVLNVITTSSASETIRPLLQGGGIRKLSFTGSTAVGRVLLEQSGRKIVRSSLELGGNAPFIVMEDADLDLAIEGALVAKMRNMGEACTAANRFIVSRQVSDEFSGRLASRMGELKVGNGLDEHTDVGPLIDGAGQSKVHRLVDEARARGAVALTGGTAPQSPGYFFDPTVLTDIHPGSDLVTEEIFGPVAAVQTFEREEDAIRIANDTVWGLSAYIFTQDLERAFRTSEALDVGMVGLNSGMVSNPSIPFGGIKESGLGREGGLNGIEEFLERKFITFPVRP